MLILKINFKNKKYYLNISLNKKNLKITSLTLTNELLIKLRVLFTCGITAQSLGQDTKGHSWRPWLESAGS